MTPERLADAILSGEARFKVGDRVATLHPVNSYWSVVFATVTSVGGFGSEGRVTLDQSLMVVVRLRDGFTPHPLISGFAIGRFVPWTFKEIHDGKA